LTGPYSFDAQEIGTGWLKPVGTVRSDLVHRNNRGREKGRRL